MSWQPVVCARCKLSSRRLAMRVSGGSLSTCRLPSLLVNATHHHARSESKYCATMIPCVRDCFCVLHEAHPVVTMQGVPATPPHM